MVKSRCFQNNAFHAPVFHEMVCVNAICVFAKTVCPCIKWNNTVLWCILQIIYQFFSNAPINIIQPLSANCRTWWRQRTFTRIKPKVSEPRFSTRLNGSKSLQSQTQTFRLKMKLFCSSFLILLVGSKNVSSNFLCLHWNENVCLLILCSCSKWAYKTLELVDFE